MLQKSQWGSPPVLIGFNSTNFIEFASRKKLICLKNGCKSASRESKSPCEVSNKTCRVENLCEVIHSDTKALNFSKSSINCGFPVILADNFDNRNLAPKRDFY